MSQGTWQIVGDILVCDLGFIANGDLASVEIEYRLDAVHVINTAIVQADQIDAIPENNVTLAATLVTCGAEFAFRSHPRSRKFPIRNSI